MALNANALVSLEEARSWLVLTGASDDTKLEEEINRATNIIEAYCDRVLKRTAAYNPVTVRYSGIDTYCLRLGVAPIDVDSTVTVTVDGTAQTVWRKDADGAPDEKDVVVGYTDGGIFHPGKPERALFLPNDLYREAGWLATKIGGVVISYSGGLITVPDDLKEACLYLVQKLWRDRSRGLAEIVTVAGPAGSTTLLDNALPRVALEALKRYRMVVVA
jgi:hypothetical protein